MILYFLYRKVYQIMKLTIKSISPELYFRVLFFILLCAIVFTGCSSGNENPGKSSVASLDEAVSAGSSAEKEKSRNSEISEQSDEKMNICDTDISMSKIEFDYTGKEIKPDKNDLMVSINGKLLKEKEDYKLGYNNNIDPGIKAAKITVTGIGKYSGSKELFFSIIPPAPSALNVTDAKGKINLSWKGIENIDGYIISYSKSNFQKDDSKEEITNKTDAVVKDDFFAGEEVSFRVCSFVGKDNDRLCSKYCDTEIVKVRGIIGKVILSESEYVYDGTQKCPEASVYSDKGEKFEENKDYKISITGRDKPGVCYAEVTGINDYAGTIKKSFLVIPEKNDFESVISDSDKIKLTWHQDTGADGYMIYYSTDKDFSSYKFYRVDDTSDCSAVLGTNSHGDARWYVKICSFIYSDKSEGEWRGIFSDTYYIDVHGPEKAESEKNTKSFGSLEKKLRSMIRNYEGSWSVYLRDLETRETLVINNRSIYPASLMKLFGMAAAYQAIVDGRISESEIYDYIEKMITVSDNDGFNQIVRRIGVRSVRDWINANGYDETVQYAGFVGGNNYEETVIEPGFNRTSAADCGRLLESIYRGECVS